MKTKRIIIALLLLGCGYSGFAQTKVRKRMFFYPVREKGPVTVTGDLLLSPNPASGEVKIVIPGISDVLDQKEYVLEVFTKQGRKRMERNWNKDPLDVTGFQPGTYLVVLRREGACYTQKLVVTP